MNKSVSSVVGKIQSGELTKEPARLVCYNRLLVIVQALFDRKDIRLCVFGSWATKIMIPNSDIDVSIVGLENTDRHEVLIALERLEGILNAFKWVTKIKAIYTATVPVIKIVSQNMPLSNR